IDVAQSAPAESEISRAAFQQRMPAASRAVVTAAAATRSRCGQLMKTSKSLMARGNMPSLKRDGIGDPCYCGRGLPGSAVVGTARIARRRDPRTRFCWRARLEGEAESAACRPVLTTATIPSSSTSTWASLLILHGCRTVREPGDAVAVGATVEA